MLATACTRTSPEKVTKAISEGSGVLQRASLKFIAGVCPACKGRWDESHMVVLYEAPTPKLSKEEEEKQRASRQAAIMTLEFAEDLFLQAHGWTKVENEYLPPDNYRFRKVQKQYDRSHAVNSQKQVYNPRYSDEKQWEASEACGRLKK